MKNDITLTDTYLRLIIGNASTARVFLDRNTEESLRHCAALLRHTLEYTQRVLDRLDDVL